MARTAADIRKQNSFAIIRSIHAGGDVSRKELADSTGLSFATVGAICADLIDQGLVIEVSRNRAPVGRPTTRLALNDEHGFLLGVDIAETYVHVVSFDASLATVSETHQPMDVHQRRPRQVVDMVRGAILAEAGKHEGSRLLGLGVSAPGIVDSAGGTSVFAPNWAWKNVPLLDLLAESVHAPIFLDNPLKALTIAELWSNQDRLEQDFVILNLGTGVGAGVALGGKVFRGRTNSAGEWGHTVIVADGRACRCGSRGCVEAYVGAPGILQTLRESFPTSELLRGDDQTATIAALATAAAAGDPVALDVLDRTSHFLGIGVATIVNLFNPDAVILAGWVAGQFGERLIDLLRPHLQDHALSVPMLASSLELQPPRENRVSLGMAASALERYLDLIPEPVTGSGQENNTLKLG
ncbi:MAG: ROK family transcriptional regulator [Propionibacteriaceae bacterium]|jgi:predicted NBD/HSP70 family sugar kinase|nr:ROK family transcriptional regulator [Propionibacteriaceae bacterium]